MKYVSLLFTPALLAALLMALTTYNDAVNGSQTAASEEGGIAINLSASGDLPGMCKLTLLRSDLSVTGGSWNMTVLPQNADAASTERGVLTGTVTGGTLTLNSDGTLASATSVQVSIQSGTGEYADVTTGNGTINISSNTENPSQLTGTLVLNF